MGNYKSRQANKELRSSSHSCFVANNLDYNKGYRAICGVLAGIV